LQHGKSLQIQQKGVIASNLPKFTDKRKKTTCQNLLLRGQKLRAPFFTTMVPFQFPANSQLPPSAADKLSG